MPQGDLVVNFAMLRAAGDDIQATVDSFNGQLDGLKQSLAGIVASWEGDARTQYSAKQAEWDTAALDLNTLLTTIKGAVLASADSMQAREMSNMAKFE